MRRLGAGLGLGAGLSLVLVHALHVAAVVATPAALAGAVQFVCHLP